MQFDSRFKKILSRTEEYASKHAHAFVTPEHVLFSLSCYATFKEAYIELGGDIDALKNDLKKYIDKWVYKVNNVSPVPSTSLNEVFQDCVGLAESLGDTEITLSHYLTLFMELCDSFAVYYFFKNAKEQDNYTAIKKICEKMNVEVIPPLQEIYERLGNENQMPNIQLIPIPIMQGGGMQIPGKENINWKELVSCLNDEVNRDDYIPLIGREQEIEDTIAALLRKNKNNPVHIGDAGVGKTAIAQGLAKRINDGNVPDLIKGYKIYSCSMGSLLAGTIYRGEFEQKLKSILEGVSKEKAILYIDEIHTICGAGGNSASDAANILKPYLLNGSIKVIGATTTKEYRKSIEADSALERRFLPILIEEPTVEQTKQILDGIKHKYEDYHKCVYTDDNINTIIHLAEKHMNDRKFPDKAIDIMDDAGAHVQMYGGNSVSTDIIEEIVAKKCNIQRESVSSDEVDRIYNLSTNMKKTVIGQNSAIDEIRQAIILSRSGLREKNKPVSNLLFVGPTGVGKTFIAQTLADQLGIPLIRKDMSEFSEAHSVSKLFGSPAGYVGYDEGGLLINEIRKTPYCVLLIDEIEKAHPDVYNVFLQIMDNAKLSDSFGKSADFSNVILIMTSNAGAADVKAGIGFGASTINTTAIDNAIKQTFKPEFRNRFDAIIKFNPMSEDMAKTIVINQLEELKTQLADKKINLTYTSDIIEHILKNGYSQEYGARNIKRVISSDIKTYLGSEILFGSLRNGGECKLSYQGNELKIN